MQRIALTTHQLILMHVARGVRKNLQIVETRRLPTSDAEICINIDDYGRIYLHYHAHKENTLTILA